MADLFEASPWLPFAGFVAIACYCAIVFFWGGRKAEARFRQNPNPTVLFREKRASGHSKKSVLTRMGGASGVLEVLVTEDELWIKGIWPMFTFIGSKYDMTHRVPLSQVKDARADGRKVLLRFTNETGTESHVELRLRDPIGFVSAVGA